jgi:hypothetical protein
MRPRISTDRFGSVHIREDPWLNWSPGRPGGRPPSPPQTRTSAINASGSSRSTIRSRRRNTPATRTQSRGRNSPPCVNRGFSFSPMVPFTTRRLPPIGYPTFRRYYETTTTAASVRPLASVSLAGGCSHGSPSFVRHEPRKARFRRQDVGEPVSPHSGSFIRARCGSLSFPGYPHMPLPCSRTPVSPHAPGLRLVKMATYCVHGGFRPPCLKQRDHDDDGYFGIQ